MSEFTLKICVVGPAKTGKTLLCRALAEQPVVQGERGRCGQQVLDATACGGACPCVCASRIPPLSSLPAADCHHKSHIPSEHSKEVLAWHAVQSPVPSPAGEYHPTAAVRVQEFSRALGVDRVKVQLWDCSGSMQYQHFWPILAKVRVGACGWGFFS